jgi:serine protease SohB
LVASTEHSSKNTTNVGENSAGNNKGFPNLWGRRNNQAAKETELSKGGHNDDKSNDADKIEWVDASKPAEDDTSSEKSEKGDKLLSQTKTTTDDGENKEDDQQQADALSKNQTQTRPGILYMNISPPNRPMPYPYIPQQPPRSKKPSSLLSSILPALIPRPQNMPPGSPYGPPPMHPSSPFSPGGNNSALISLVMRLVLISFGTLLLDLFGMGSHSDAFLPTPAQHYTFERVNDRYRRDRNALHLALDSPPPGIGKYRWRRAFWRRRREAATALSLAEENKESGIGAIESPTLSNGALYNRTVIIVDMKPDSRVGNGMADHLRDSVSFIIEQHRDYVDKQMHTEKAYTTKQLPLSSFLLPRTSSIVATSTPVLNQRTPNGMRSALGNEVEVVLLLDSGGGTVQDYGLASSQLARLRDEPQIKLSVCVDRVAASGGYMMACQATPGQLFAAPFAMIGSIGVLMETVNIHEVLKRYGVKPLVIKAGKNKAPLKTLGEVSDEEMQMAQDDADGIHEAFQRWVMKSRPNVVVSKDWIEKVCTGAVFLGTEACDLGLVDRVITSDEYVSERIAAGDRVLRLLPYKGPQFGGLKISPLDLLLSSMDAEGRLHIRDKICTLGMRIVRSFAPMLRLGAVVGVLNHLASLQNPYPGYSWAA